MHPRHTGITKTLFQIWIQDFASPASTWRILCWSLASMGDSVNHIEPTLVQSMLDTRVPLSYGYFSNMYTQNNSVTYYIIFFMGYYVKKKGFNHS